MEKADVENGDIKSVIVAGGFGYHITEESIRTIGLIPDLPNARFCFAGNSSLEGARRLLMDKGLSRASSKVAKETNVIELANEKSFEERYVRAMHF